MPTASSGTGDELLLTADLQLVGRRPLGERARFELAATPEYRAGLNETEASLRNWLQLPPGYNPRTQALAQRWLAEETEPQQLVRRALTMFREQPFRYTFEPPRLGRHSADEFLFDTRAGFCEHYSSAFVLLMRHLGIPARVVTGYQGGERNPVDGYWVVRQADAHAWAEVWFAGRGWTRVDPTAAVAPQRIERGQRLRDPGFDSTIGEGALPLWQRVRFNLDALGNVWNQWVLSYDRSRQQSLLSQLGLSAGDWRELAALLAATLAVLIGGVALITLHPRRPKDPLERAYQEYCDRLAAAGLGRLQHETAARHLGRIAPSLDEAQRREAQRIVNAYNRLRYGEPEVGREAVRHFRQSVQAFKP
ncbi:MAG: DUF4129 domain-containing transglutaminase family protein, partial [Burkholderiaceae bacterium]